MTDDCEYNVDRHDAQICGVFYDTGMTHQHDSLVPGIYHKGSTIFPD